MTGFYGVDSKSRRLSMMKRTVARLLLFGIPFCMAYAFSHRSPAPARPTFVICGYSGGSEPGRAQTVVIARDRSGCEAATKAARTKEEQSRQAAPALKNPASNADR